MSNTSPVRLIALLTLALPLLQACGESRETPPATGADTSNEAPAVSTLDQDPIESTGPVQTQPTGTQAGPQSEALAEVDAEAEPPPAAGSDTAPDIDPDALEYAGEIELKQYTVAWVGSGTLGGGTLTVDGVERPFKITGLGVGGFGASSVEATGEVYNLPSPEAFPGTYGNARLGLTAGESGSGKLWLRNPDGVIIKLESQMRGLALASGVDGLLIHWDDDQDSDLDKVMDGTEDVVGDGIEAGADAVQGGVDTVKGWFKKD